MPSKVTSCAAKTIVRSSHCLYRRFQYQWSSATAVISAGTQIPFPAVSKTVSLSIIVFADNELLPAPVPPRTNDKDGLIICPSYYTPLWASECRSDWWHVKGTGRRFISNLKGSTCKGIDVREYSWEQWYPSQDTPFLVSYFFWLRRW